MPAAGHRPWHHFKVKKIVPSVVSKPLDPDRFGTRSTQAGAEMTVYFDGGCPLCRREISAYRGLSALRPVCFADISDPDLVPPAGIRPEELAARFHVRHADGRLVSGARAFLALWAALPGWRWLARMGSLPGMPHLMEWVYRSFLRIRPAVQRMVRRMEPDAAAQAVSQAMQGWRWLVGRGSEIAVWWCRRL